MPRMRPLVLAAVMFELLIRPAAAQSLTGALIGTIQDEQGAIVAGVGVVVRSPAMLGGTQRATTDGKGRFRFPALPPGTYSVEVTVPRFAPYHEENLAIGAGTTIERTVILKVGGVEKSIVVEGTGSPIDARDPGFVTRFGPQDLQTIPTRRASMFDFIRAAPGTSPTSPGSGTVTSTSSFGSGTNENGFLIDGTNFTCPCAGVARAEPGVDFIQEIHVQSIGASAEFGSVQGAVINVITKQGGNRFLYDASYYWQSARLTSRPVELPVFGSSTTQSAYERSKYRDLTTTVGGPLRRNHAWFFAGYQHLRDYDSQPGTDPAFPRTYEQDKMFGKVTWKWRDRWHLVQSAHGEVWLNPTIPTRVTPIEATQRTSGTVPAITFADLRHTMTSNTYWDARVGHFAYAQDSPSQGAPSMPSRRDEVTGITTGAAPNSFKLRIARTTAKATINHYRALFGVDHQWRGGVQFERGVHKASAAIPTGTSYVDRNGAPFQALLRPPFTIGGLSLTGSAFISDAITLANRVTINAGVRYDHSRAISPALRAVGADGEETGAIIEGLGTLYTWNLVSPRLGVTAKLTRDGRTLLRASYGRFHQGILTAEFEDVHPGNTTTTTYEFNAATGGYTTFVEEVDPNRDIRIDSRTRAPRTDEYSIGIDRELGRGLSVALAYIRKGGEHFIAWQDIGGLYAERVRLLPDGQQLPVFELVNSTRDRLYLLTNPRGLSLTYNGLVMAAEKRRANGWQAFGSYTWSKAAGLQAASGAPASGAQVSSVVPPALTVFGRDPNHFVNAYGRMPNDRPHVWRLMGSVAIPRTGLVVAANVQHFSGKPWTATAQLRLPQGNQRILIEPRGSRRLSSQSLVDIRVSRAISSRRFGRIDLLLDVLNALDDRAEESIATDNRFSPNFGQPSVFMDPRRAMLGVRFWLGQ